MLMFYVVFKSERGLGWCGQTVGFPMCYHNIG